MHETDGEGFESYGSLATLAEVQEDHKSEKLGDEDSKDKAIIRITQELIKEVQQELCTIKLCWPDGDFREGLYLKSLPSSYCTVSDKEKVLAWHAENFRRQFRAKYPGRKPLLLVCENECGVQVSESHKL